MGAMIGSRFGRLTVRGFEPGSRTRKRRYICRCDCGAETRVPANDLNSGHAASCGCLRVERIREKTLTHGATRRRHKEPLYAVWVGMAQRCDNPNNKDYAYYGGRGIKVCARWRDFALFRLDMGDRPTGTTIDRIDNDGDYEPSNCRWATRAEQVANRGRSRSSALDAAISA